MHVLEQFINCLKKDGEDHIRVGHNATTELGKIASLSYSHPFNVPGLGAFNSTDGFVIWLLTGVDEARTNNKIRARGKVKEYKEYLLYAKFYQLCSMRKVIKANYKKLPFVSYIEFESGIKQNNSSKESPTEVQKMMSLIASAGAKKSINDLGWKWTGHMSKVEAKVKALVDHIIANGHGKHEAYSTDKPNKNLSVPVIEELIEEVPEITQEPVDAQEDVKEDAVDIHDAVAEYRELNAGETQSEETDEHETIGPDDPEGVEVLDTK